MKTIIRLSLIVLSFNLAACGSEDLFSIRGINSTWTPQYQQVSQYFSMSNTAFYDGAPFTAEIGVMGNVKNADGLGLTSVIGVVGSAIQFSGADDRVSVPASFANNNNQFSISVWVKRASQVGRGCIVTSRDESPARGYSICIDASERPEVKIGQGSGPGNWTTLTGTPVLSNSWTHIAVTYNGTNLSLYKNGVLESTSVSAFVANATRPLYVGASGTELTPSASDPFTGTIDEVAIWSSVLSAADVKLIYDKQVR